MASVAKFKMTDTPRLLSHCNRTQQKLGAHIDQSRTPMNYNLAHRASPEKTDYQFTKARLNGDGVKMLNRDNVNAVCSWVVTLPKDLCHETADPDGESHYVPDDPEEARKFFRCAYDFFAQRHGEENVVSAYVHMDENCPHMHFIFTPVVRDKKHGGYKVSAKEALEGCYGVPFQMLLQDYVSKQMGREMHMVRKDNIDYERNVKQLKKQTLNAKAAALSRQIRRAEEELDRKKRSVRVMEKAAEAADVGVRVTSSGGYTVMRDADWRTIQAQLKALKILRAERQAIHRELDELEKPEFSDENQKLREENEHLRRQAEELSRENEILRLEVSGLEDFMGRTYLHGQSLRSVYETDRKAGSRCPGRREPEK